MMSFLRRQKRRAAAAASGPGEVLQRVKGLEIRTRAFVDSLFGGEYPSLYVGRGLDFSHVRAYQVGDDIRAIDWKVTARLGGPFVRRFVEERDLLVTLVVDVSASARFGPGERSISEVATEVGAALAFAAARNNDRVSLVLSSDRVERAIPPGSGRRHIVRTLAELLTHEPVGRGTDLVPALEAVARARAGRALVFVISDFIQSPMDEAFRSALGRAARSNDLVAVRISGAAMDDLPDLGWVEVTDPETGRRALVSTGSRRVRERYRQDVEDVQVALATVMAESGAEVVDVDVEEDALAALVGFFKLRRGPGR